MQTCPRRPARRGRDAFAVSVKEARRAATAREPDALADALTALTEKERRSLHDELRELTKAVLSPNDRDPALDRCFFIALWGTGTSRDVRNAIASWRFAPDPRIADVVAVRPQKTIDALTRTALRNDWDRGAWFVIRDLIRRGVIPHPQTEEYYEHLVRALPFLTSTVSMGTHAEERLAGAVVAQLETDGPLPGELLRALEIEEAVNTLANAYVGDAWMLACEQAMRAGIYRREQLLDVGVDGQLRDFRKSASAFFRKLFDRLDPSPAEIAERLDKLVRIVASSNPGEQVAAANLIARAAKSGTPTDHHAIAAAVATPLTGSHKGAAVTALRLVVDSGMPVEMQAGAAVHGLGHPHADVQDRALRIIEQCGGNVPAGVRADAMVWIDTVAPALHDRMVRVVGVELLRDSDEAHKGDLSARRSAVEIPLGSNIAELLAVVERNEMPGPIRFEAVELPALGAPVEPIVDVAELVGAVTAILGGSGTPLDLERVIDGFGRLDPSRVSDSLLSPMRAAAEAVENPFASGGWYGWGVRGMVSLAALYWSTRREPPPLPYLAPARKKRFRAPPQLAHDLVQPKRDADGQWWAAAFDGSSYNAGLGGFVSARLWEAVTAGLGRARPSLALPSSADGWLAADELLDRLDRNRSLKIEPGRFDAVQALLRLRPARGTEERPGPTHDPVATAIHVFQNGSRADVDEGLARAIVSHDGPLAMRLVTFPKVGYQPEITVLRYNIGVGAGPLRRDDPVGQLLAELVPPHDRPVVNVRWTDVGTALSSSDQLLVDWTTIGLPRHREFVAARAASMLAEDPDSNRSTDCLHLLVSAASAPDYDLTFGVTVLLAVALSDRNVVTRSAAADLLQDAATDGRLDPGKLGDVLAQLSNGGVVKPARFAKAASGIVTSSPLVAERVRQVLCTWLGLVDGVPRDLHAVLETLELACDRSGTGVDVPAAIDKLRQASAGSSKRAESAKRLLNLPVEPPVQAISLAGHALLDRAERWQTAGA